MTCTNFAWPGPWRPPFYLKWRTGSGRTLVQAKRKKNTWSRTDKLEDGRIWTELDCQDWVVLGPKQISPADTSFTELKEGLLQLTGMDGTSLHSESKIRIRIRTCLQHPCYPAKTTNACTPFLTARSCTLLPHKMNCFWSQNFGRSGQRSFSFQESFA